MAKVSVCITLSEDVLKEVDECAKSVGMKRSVFLEWTLKNMLPTIKERAKAFWEWL